jgi:HAE1 family hydrophobic/amphiphilic exporter-1
MKLAELSIRKPVMMTMLILSFVVLGVFSLSRLGIDLFPKVEFPFVVVTIVYPGAGPEEMETLVSEPIEEEISSISGLKNVTSTSQEGLAFIAVEFDLDVDVDLAAIDVKDKIDKIRSNLPRDIRDPVIQKFDFAALPILDLAVSSPRPLEETYKLTEDIIKTGLSRVPGVAGITISGGREREIHIHLSKRLLREQAVSLDGVIGQIAAHNLNVPAGHIVEGRKEISIRMAAEFTDLDQLANLELSFDKGKRLRLEQLGWVEDGFKEQRESATFNGEASVGIALIKKADANSVQVAAQVEKELVKIRKELPSDVRIDVARDRSQFIKDSVDDVFGNLIVGALLTAAILFLFLHSLPTTVIAAVSMPISIIATFVLIDFAGFTLNFMSLMGLAISVGILTANSIVVLENIERYRLLGFDIREAASKGTSEIALAVAASTLTNIVVFTPMAFMSGITGQFFKQFGLTVAFSTIISLLISFTLTPMMASRKLGKPTYIIFALTTFLVTWWRMGLDTGLLLLLIVALGGVAMMHGWLDRFARAWDKFYDDLADDYKRSLAWVLDHRKRVIGMTALLLIGSIALLPLGYIGAEFFPKADQGAFAALIEMPVGSSLAETDRIVKLVAERILKEPYLTSVYTSTGRSEGGATSSGQGINLGMIICRMVDKAERPLSVAEFLDQIRPKLADIPGATITVKESQPMGGGGGESDIQVEVLGNDIKILNELTDSLMTHMRSLRGVVNIESSWKLGRPELRVIPDREAISDLGLSPAAVGMTLRNLIEGSVASKFREKGDEYDIRVKLDPAEFGEESDISTVYLKSGDKQIQLSQLVRIESTAGPTTISHKNKQRVVYVTADVSGTTSGQAVNMIRQYTDKLNLPPGHSIYFGGQTERMQESFSELLKAMVLATILTYMLMAAMLESFKHPFTIILTLPLGLIGVFLALFLTGNAISMFALMAMIMLVGIVVNNGILLIDYTNTLRLEGLGLRAAILEACPIRLRPIIMTNLAAIVGMLPLALGIGAGGEFRAPLAIVSIGGLITSTVFTIYVIPIIYQMFEKGTNS